MVITGGASTPEVVTWTHEQNQKKFKVQNIIVFTSEASKKFSVPYLSEKKDEIDGLVCAVETRFKTVLEKCDQIVNEVKN